MDERLEEIVERNRGNVSVLSLCLSAVLSARDDRRQDSGTVRDNVVAVHLARVLALAFVPSEQLPTSQRPWNLRLPWMTMSIPPIEIRRRGQRLGDACLFSHSQEYRPAGRAHGWDPQRLLNWGTEGFRLAAVNTMRWNSDERDALNCLADDFIKHSALLGKAGELLGFSQSLEHFILRQRPAVTMDEFLATLAAYQHEPTLATWQCLADCAAARRWHDPEFQFDLPPSPAA